MTIPAAIPCPEIADSGRIKIGAGYKLLPPAIPPASVKDAGRIRLGAGYKLSRSLAR